MYIVYKTIMAGNDTYVVEEDAARAKELYNENVNEVNLFTAGIAKIVKSTEAHHTDSNDDILANINFLMLDKQREHLNTIIDSLDPDSELRNSMEGIQNLLDAVSDEEFHKKEEDLHQQAIDFMASTEIDAISLDDFLIQYKDTLTEEQLKEGHAILHKFPEYITEPQWICTDSDSNQYRKDLSENKFLFKEDRVIQPDTGETEVYESEINLADYTQLEMFDSVIAFGYSFNEMCTWIDEGINLDLIAECIFESE